MQREGGRLRVQRVSEASKLVLDQRRGRMTVVGCRKQPAREPDTAITARLRSPEAIGRGTRRRMAPSTASVSARPKMMPREDS